MEIPQALINPHYQDRYFDVVNALAEARQIYFENCQVLQSLRQRKVLYLGETGFGAGRVLLALLEYLTQHWQASATCETPAPWQIDYASVELHPLSLTQLADILTLFKTNNPDDSLNLWVEKVIALYQCFDPQQVNTWQVHSLEAPFGSLQLRLWFGEALEMVKALQRDAAPLRDLWCLEGHGPKKNPEIWRTEVIQAVAQQTRVGGHCATFTVSAELRRDLRAAGFLTDRLPGLGGKKQVLRGTRRPTPVAEPEHVLISPADPSWPQRFEQVAAELRAHLAPVSGLLGIAHIGSTSVPGLPAQATIDMQLLVSSGLNVPALLAALRALGYQEQTALLGVSLWFSPPDSPPNNPKHQLYVGSVENAFLHKQLLLRDYLRQAPERAQAYGQLKRELAARYPGDLRAYAGAKTQLINRLLAEAGALC